MLHKKKLILGQVVELVVSEGNYEGRYRTRIEDVGEKILAVGAPIDHGEVVPLREGTKVKLIFWDEAAVYSFQGKIMQRIAVPIPMLILELPESIDKVQRRNYVRVTALYPISFLSVTRQGLSEIQHGTMLDLSGGGMRFLTKERVENDSLLYVFLSLPSGEMKTPVRVCRVEAIDDRKHYRVSVEFHDISERDRDRIISCVFEIQRAMRKKGLE
ncbi:flagellar brake protein [Desulfosporosinus fructosivorans]|uniref:Flagellar brake protein n=1 Tax=Desulfosporosinus fructosivorans TaxID=2018669 RepID=A0A4Z0RB17_9FIRM|nr:flagellar brake domain-containing protein [Desulfosporosinus fructosivorans]TGE40000.1 flagellar brake protein [Desulfosporosinus fructosivorans]